MPSRPVELRSPRLYFVWRDYQRRAETLAARLSADIIYMPNVFRSRWFRPLDYLIKTIKTFAVIWKRRPSVCIFQAPPLFSVLPVFLLRSPYIVDAHNAIFQAWWGRLPLSNILARNAERLIVHNEEIQGLALKQFPDSKIVVLRDPLEHISGGGRRSLEKILFICSFNSDEPFELITTIVKNHPEKKFFLTADKFRLPRAIRKNLELSSNVVFTGFLPTDQYHALLLSCAACIVLTNREASQPSGACEALSSDTPLILSKTSLTEKLFGQWAMLVDNDPESITQALNQVGPERDLSAFRSEWEADTAKGLRTLEQVLS